MMPDSQCIKKVEDRPANMHSERDFGLRKRRKLQHNSSDPAPEDSDGDADEFTEPEPEPEEHYSLSKKHKASAQSLLSGTPMGELYAEMSTTKNDVAKPRVQPARAAKSKMMSTPTIRQLVTELAVTSALPYVSHQRGRMIGPSVLSSSGDRSKEVNGLKLPASRPKRVNQINRDPQVEDSYVIVPDTAGQRTQDSSQLESAAGGSVKSTGTRTQRSNPRTARNGTSPRGKTPVQQNPVNRREKEDDQWSQVPEDSAHGPESESDEYDFVERPQPIKASLNRSEAAMILDPNRKEQPVTAIFDTGSHSDFISLKIVERHKLTSRPLRPEHIAAYHGLEEICRPLNFVRLELRFGWEEDFSKESFRILQNSNFDLILGANTLENRRIQLQGDNFKQAFPSLKKGPTKGQLKH